MARGLRPYIFPSWEFCISTVAAGDEWRGDCGRSQIHICEFDFLARPPRPRARHYQHDEVGGQIVHQPKTAEKLAKEHGVDEKTVRRAGKFQEAASKLGIEKEIAAGKVKAPEAAVVKAAKALPEKPSKKDVEKAVKAVKSAARKKPRGTVKAKSDFKALSPTKCLEAIEHYAREFMERCPNRYLELKEIIERLSDLVG